MARIVLREVVEGLEIRLSLSLPLWMLVWMMLKEL
jgi:hypothetical protein